MNKEKCENCRFVGTFRLIMLDGSRSEQEGVLVCRLNPPVTVVDYSFSDPEQDWKFPSVHSEDWCGQYKFGGDG